MKNHALTFIATCLILMIVACNPEADQGPFQLSSPDGAIQITFSIDEEGRPTYEVALGETPVILPSHLGFEFKDQASLGNGMAVVSHSETEQNETWTPVWGEDKEVVNHYKELSVELEETAAPNRKMTLLFRAYNDGIAFRYALPSQDGLDEVVIMDENTEFALTGDHQTWWIPGDWDIYEHLYNTTLFSEIDATSKRDHPNLGQTFIPQNAVNTPVTMRTAEGLHLSFHEANLTDYSGMTLKVDKENQKWVSELVGSADDSKVKTQTPFVTPWRTIQIAENAGNLIESKLIVNLNEPNKLANTDWIKPTKYMGIWWEMHLGMSSWDMASGKHGATTENTKRYIDFCAANGIGALLVEGWNTGWEEWLANEREDIFDFITPYPDYDLEEVVAYGKKKGVEIVMHHETSAAVTTYERQLDTAYQLMEDLGIKAVKTGYVGTIIPKGEYHHGQYMVRHYRKVLETAAKHGVMVDAHEPIKATGLRRTYPNMMAREGLRGQEFNAWSIEMNPPEHLTIVPFTRMLSGPVDFTPGIFDIKFNKWKEKNQVNTTLAKQLATYVVIYSPLQMAADLPENYEGQPAFQFIRDVPVDWDASKVLDGAVGDFVTIARKEKGSDDWYIGSLTDENAREITINFDFLDEGAEYEAMIYKDGDDAHWDDNPTSISITNEPVKKGDEMKVQLAAGGGVAIRIAKK
jgi:hypothetical protein